MCELLGGGTHHLEDDLDRAGQRIRAGYRQGDALTLLVHAEDDELPRLGLSRHERRLDLKLDHRGVQDPFICNSVHSISVPEID